MIEGFRVFSQANSQSHPLDPATLTSQLMRKISHCIPIDTNQSCDFHPDVQLIWLTDKVNWQYKTKVNVAIDHPEQR